TGQESKATTMYKQIDRCRICGNPNLLSLLHLGVQSLTGVFPKTRDAQLTAGPLELVKCEENDERGSSCGLVQLNHSYNFDELYGLSYGYRSGLNQSMVQHLTDKVSAIQKLVDLKAGELVVDIGSNDGTLLKAYHRKDLTFIGIDPTAAKFRHFY